LLNSLSVVPAKDWTFSENCLICETGTEAPWGAGAATARAAKRVTGRIFEKCIVEYEVEDLISDKLIG
jgi:hypothetical protein